MKRDRRVFISQMAQFYMLKMISRCPITIYGGWSLCVSFSSKAS